MRADECLFLVGKRSCSGHHRKDLFGPKARHKRDRECGGSYDLSRVCGLGPGDHHCGAGGLCVGERDAARKKKAPVKGLAQVKQDKITIHGPKNDGTYIVEFKTADGVALAFSVSKGGGTAVLEYFQDKIPYGLAVTEVARSRCSWTASLTLVRSST